MLGILRKILQVAGTVATIAEMLLAALGSRKSDTPPQ